LLLTDCQEKIRKHSTSAFKENSAGILLNFDFNRQSSCKNSNRDFGRQSAGKFFAFNGQSSSKKLKWFFWWAGGWQINFVFNGQSSSKKSKHPFCGQAVGNILNCFFFNGHSPRKISNLTFGGKMASKNFLKNGD
jgi:hypothetical protein